MTTDHYTCNFVYLINIARAANKYSFKLMETCSRQPIIKSHGPIDIADQLTRLIRLTQLFHHERLLSTMIGLMSSSMQCAYLAMTLSDELDLRALRGAAYLEVIQKPDVVLKSTERLFITRAQQHRLLAGYYRLTSTWDKLRLTPLPFEHAHSCGATRHQQDVLGRLKLVQDYDWWGSATYMHDDCRMNAKKVIGEMIKKVEDALSDYLSEPGDDD
ncbi:hypothetical protein BYT27DRAFT_7221738 [Phlegmacium glaucopus]|nr:hypothetical protein BYT27DRAFT_7221738 [Phlegmacium glaucopus]